MEETFTIVAKVLIFSEVHQVIFGVVFHFFILGFEGINVLSVLYVLLRVREDAVCLNKLRGLRRHNLEVIIVLIGSVNLRNSTIIFSVIWRGMFAVRNGEAEVLIGIGKGALIIGGVTSVLGGVVAVNIVVLY